MKNPQRALHLLLLATSLAAAIPASAQTWSGGGPGTSWATPGNWVGGVAPVSGNTTVVTFPTPTTAQNSSFIPGPFTVNALHADGGPYFFSGGVLSFGGAAPSISFLAGGIASIFSNPLDFPVTTVVDTTSSGVLFSGGLSGAGGITKIGPGGLQFNGNTMYSGTTTINAGGLVLGNGTVGPGVVLDVVNNGNLQFQTGGILSVMGTLTGTGSVNIGAGTTQTTSGPLLHTGQTVVFGSGTLNGALNGSSNVSVFGTWNASESTVGALGNGGGAININSGTLHVGLGNATNTFDGCLGGVGNLEKIGSGTLVLAATCMHSGLTTLTGGTLRIGNGAVGPGVVMDIVNNATLQFNVPGGILVNSVLNGTGTLTILGGSAVANAGPFVHAGPTTVNAGATLDASINNNSRLTVNGTFNTGGATVGSLLGSGSVFINAGTLTAGGDNTNALFTGTLGGAAALTKVGAGILINGGNSVNGGLTTVSAGTYRIGNGASGPGVVFSVVNNGTFEANSPALTLNGTFSGPGALVLFPGIFSQGAGTFTHTGPTTINSGGTLAASSINNSAVLTIAAGGTMNTGGATVGQLTGAGQLNVNSGGFVTGIDNANSTFSGGIAVFGTFVKNGTGRFTFSGTGTQGGTLAVNQGSMVLTGTTTTPIVVNNGTTLLGTGTASGGIVVNAGATLSPGLSPGLLNSGNLAVVGVLLEEIEGPTLGTQYDSVNVTGTVDLTGATLTLAGAYVPLPGDIFTIITNDGVDPVTGTFAGLPEGATIPFHGRPLTISYVGGTGNDVTLAFVAALGPGAAVPTMSQWMLMLLAGLLLGAGVVTMRARSGR